MMYLIVKICSDRSHHSCSCQTDQVYSDSAQGMHSISHQPEFASNVEDEPQAKNYILDHLMTSPIDFKNLDLGSPLRLAKSSVRRQGKVTSVTSSIT